MSSENDTLNRMATKFDETGDAKHGLNKGMDIKQSQDTTKLGSQPTGTTGSALEGTDKATDHAGPSIYEKTADIGRQAFDKAAEIGHQAFDKAAVLGHEAYEKAAVLGSMAKEKIMGDEKSHDDHSSGSDIRSSDLKMSNTTATTNIHNDKVNSKDPIHK
jgi:hypothetical protein